MNCRGLIDRAKSYTKTIKAQCSKALLQRITCQNHCCSELLSPQYVAATYTSKDLQNVQQDENQAISIRLRIFSIVNLKFQ